MMRSTIYRSGAVLLALALIAVSACGRSPLGSGEHSFTLSTVDGASLPVGYFILSNTHEITAGTLVLRPGGALTETFTIRCKSELPPNTTCSVPADGRTVRDGTYSLSEGWVDFGEQNGTRIQFPATFSDRSVEIVYGLGFGPRNRFLFVR